MRAKAYRIESTWMIVGPGLSRMEPQIDEEAGLVTMTCASCGERTLRYLTLDDEFAVRHRADCRLERAIADVLAEDPNAEGKHVRIVVWGEDGPELCADW